MMAFDDSSATATSMRTMPACEIEVFAVSASRGDIFPACLRLGETRTDQAWTDRMNIVLAVGPRCPTHVLDMACRYMPRATEPRLLRAAASLCQAAMSKDDEARDLFNDAARRDLMDAIEIDEADVAARAMLFALVGADY